MPIRLDKMPPALVNIAKAADAKIAEAGLTAHVAEVGVVLDVSGSAQPLYQSGKMQRLLEMTVALAARFDDDGKVPVWLFHHGVAHTGKVTIANFSSFLRDALERIQWGSTRYAPVLAAVRKHFAPSWFKKSKLPAYVLFATDGANEDRAQAEQEIVAASSERIFWQFMAIGPSEADFPFLQKLDTLTTRKIDNAGFFCVQDPATIRDEDLYAKMLSEYPAWIQRARAAGVL